MKLNLIFIVMDFLTLLAYPAVLVYNWVHLSSSAKENAIH